MLLKRLLPFCVALPCWMLMAGYYSGGETVTTSGTAVILSNASPVPPAGCIALTIQVDKDNVGTIWIGGSNVSAANEIGIALSPGMTPPASAYFAPSSTNALYVPATIYIDSTTSGDKVKYTCAR